MTTKTFTLLRHGKVQGLPALYGNTDIALSAQGWLDSASAMHKIHGQLTIDTIITSPLIRCAAIAEKFATAQKISLQYESRLKEMNFGVWDGIPFDEMGETWQELEAFWNSPFLVHPPQGEMLDFFAKRVIQAWEILIQNNTGQHQLLVCHGGVIRIILAHVLHIDWRNASLYKQLYINYNSHTRITVDHCDNALPVIQWIGMH